MSISTNKVRYIAQLISEWDKEYEKVLALSGGDYSKIDWKDFDLIAKMSESQAKVSKALEELAHPAPPPPHVYVIPADRARQIADVLVYAASMANPGSNEKKWALSAFNALKDHQVSPTPKD